MADYYLVIHTQDVENYGAHDWDPHTGEDCPQYWKYKGGVSLAVLLERDQLTTRDANYAARSIEELRRADLLEDSNYFKTYYSGHEVVEARDLFIQHADEEPDSRQYEFFGMVYFPHLEKKQRRFCWKKCIQPRW